MYNGEEEKEWERTETSHIPPPLVIPNVVKKEASLSENRYIHHF
jgi:hypothetical protein